MSAAHLSQMHALSYVQVLIFGGIIYGFTVLNASWLFKQQVANKCHSFGNYNSLKAVLAGLQCTPIFRLKKTWKEVSSKKRKLVPYPSLPPPSLSLSPSLPPSLSPSLPLSLPLSLFLSQSHSCHNCLFFNHVGSLCIVVWVAACIWCGGKCCVY